MPEIQQAIRCHMPVRFPDLDLADVAKIEFICKGELTSVPMQTKTDVWLPDGTGSAVTGQDAEGHEVILIPWTREETFLFPAGRKFYFHARIHYTDTTDEPYVPIVALEMGPSLFTAEEVDAE